MMVRNRHNGIAGPGVPGAADTLAGGLAQGFRRQIAESAQADEHDPFDHQPLGLIEFDLFSRTGGKGRDGLKAANLLNQRCVAEQDSIFTHGNDEGFGLDPRPGQRCHLQHRHSPLLSGQGQSFQVRQGLPRKGLALTRENGVIGVNWVGFQIVA